MVRPNLALRALWILLAGLFLASLAPSAARLLGQLALAEDAVAQEVPRTTEETQAAGRAAAPELVARYEAAPKTADPKYLPILEQLQGLTAGSADPKAEDLLKQFMSLAKGDAASSAEAAELRTLYDDVFTPMMAGWQGELEEDGVGLEERARLANLHRTALRELTRDLMRDTNAVAVLHERDRVKYGQPTGPTFEQLFNKEKLKPKTSDEQAWQAIIGSSQRHNKSVSDAAKGN